MITLESINKTYTSGGRMVSALQNVNLHIRNGEVFGIIGRSGAGKSTLIRMLNLLERPSSGVVSFQGNEISALGEDELRPVRQKIGMVFQHFNLLQSSTVLDNVCFPLKLAGLSKAAMHERANEVLALVGLDEHLHKYPRQLSGGQQQRVGIARALANKPALLLCDEATSALDPETTQSILRLLREINQNLGLTIVLITHSMDVIRAVCDRVAVIESGAVVESGDVIDVFLHPQNTVTQTLLAESGIDAEGWQEMAPGVQGMLLRLSFKGDATSQPLISRVSRELNLDISILQGSVSRIKGTPYGQLVVAVQGADEDQKRLAQTLLSMNVQSEVLRT
ncbi:ATP-binding cassette domain-containing protein [Paenalcaligenes niemegkensis]|uniref:methionine ABC transporter ATP-binding protein n=1 Tax=Paenalcaligenes niemegkensis TaxID=2895469 RepID=UPI001EE919E7|nr:ATP-binding cassette domain-containing protein [Paenalcaligenes niemegkensis]MCQ9615874.1 ATP-binding cassette domain-containing protein [Paenalcaligenes niemegkensis]